MSDRLSPEVMVPLTSCAFMRGHLVHTNKILVLLGDNYFLGMLQPVLRIHFGVDPDPRIHTNKILVLLGDNYFLGTMLQPVFRIHDILVWIRPCPPLTNGFGSGSCYFRHWPSVFLLVFEGTFTSFFNDKKSKRSHKTAGIKVFLPVFACW